MQLMFTTMVDNLMQLMFTTKGDNLMYLMFTTKKIFYVQDLCSKDILCT